MRAWLRRLVKGKAKDDERVKAEYLDLPFAQMVRKLVPLWLDDKVREEAAAELLRHFGLLRSNHDAEFSNDQIVALKDEISKADQKGVRDELAEPVERLENIRAMKVAKFSDVLFKRGGVNAANGVKTDLLQILDKSAGSVVGFLMKAMRMVLDCWQLQSGSADHTAFVMCESCVKAKSNIADLVVLKDNKYVFNNYIDTLADETHASWGSSIGVRLPIQSLVGCITAIVVLQHERHVAFGKSVNSRLRAPPGPSGMSSKPPQHSEHTEWTEWVKACEAAGIAACKLVDSNDFHQLL